MDLKPHESRFIKKQEKTRNELIIHGHQQLTQALDQEGAYVGPGWPEVLAVVVRDESVQLHQLVDRQYAVAQVPALSPRLVVGGVGQHRLVANVRRVLYSPVDLLAQGLQGA